MLAGREMGLGIMTSLANIDVIKGKPTQKALLMRAMIQSQGHKWADGDVSDTRAVVRGCRKGETEWSEVVFTADQAKKAGIDLGKYPADKLYARASSRLARRKFADVIMGMPYTDDEAEDGDDTAEAGGGTAAPAIEAPRPAQRTAQRRQPARGAATPAPAAPAAATDRTAPPATAQAAPPGDGLPPLPGEDEPAVPPTSPAAPEPGSTDSPRTDDPPAATGQVGIIARHFLRLGFGDDERDQRLAITSVIAGTDPIGSTKELTQSQAKTVADTLARCKDRDRLIELLASQEARSAREIREDGDGDA
jgi:hypothetical protein